MYIKSNAFLRDFVNRKIENDEELLKVLIDFSDVKIYFDFEDPPFNNKRFIVSGDKDGFLDEVLFGDLEGFDFEIADKDLRILISNQYFRNHFTDIIYKTVVSSEEKNVKSFMGKGLKIEGPVNTIQALSPLAYLIIDNFSPFLSAFKRSPLNRLIRDLTYQVIEKEKLIVKKDDFEKHIKKIRNLRDKIKFFNNKIMEFKNSEY